MAFPLVLVMGCAFGAFMGLLIDGLKIPAFIITLAGMFFLRGVSYLISEESIPINHPVYEQLSDMAWMIPGGGRLSAMGPANAAGGGGGDFPRPPHPASAIRSTPSAAAPVRQT
ncbi:Inner membrane ABC transporter permease protein yjfF [Pluralibacter gergoviae]|nr:Inner membrane ABC transporter permease protein yjfF [Pluralibacter gergoviae]